MIQKSFFFLLGVTLIVLSGCNTKFSVNGDYIETPIVHFLLDQGEEYHFLKLNKSFLQEGNALEFAKDPELSYFDHVEAIVEEVKGGNVVRSWTLEDTTINNKSDGVFYGPEQKLYFFKANDLDEQATYRLKIDIDNGKFQVTGQTRLLQGVNIKFPLQNQAFKFADNDVQANGYKSTIITYDVGNGATFKLQVRFDYVEYTSPVDSTHRSLLWDIGSANRSDIGSATATFPANGEAFYEFVSKKIPVNSEVTRRNVRGMEIILTAGSEELLTYMLSAAPSSSFAQNKPVFTNVDGGLGIFSARVTKKQYKHYFTIPQTRCIDQNSTKELCNGTYTYQLKFCSDIPLDNSTNFKCN